LAKEASQVVEKASTSLASEDWKDLTITTTFDLNPIFTPNTINSIDWPMMPCPNAYMITSQFCRSFAFGKSADLDEAPESKTDKELSLLKEEY